MLDVSLIEEESEAQTLAPEWDALAVARALPMCAPGWMLAWWRHLAPTGAALRIVTVRENGELIALAPWFLAPKDGGRTDVRFLGAEYSDRVDVLCAPGREPEVAAAIREAILASQPAPDLISFEATPATSPWPAALAQGLSGRARLSPYRNSVIPAPTVELPADLRDAGEEAWLGRRSSNFRSQMRRMRRRLESRGGSVRMIGAEETPQAIEALLRLHEGRWEGKGTSHLTRPGMAEHLGEAAATLGPERLRLWAAEIEGELISVQLFAAAGGEVKYWNGGWLEEHADLKPTMLTILAALEDGIARGERRLDLGAGQYDYKMRFADGDAPLAWGGVIVRNARWPRSRAELAPRVLRYRAKLAAEALPDPLTERIAGAVRARRG